LLVVSCGLLLPRPSLLMHAPGAIPFDDVASQSI
jgi:hypothetical protein